MSRSKTATLTFRTKPALKEALRSVALEEHRSIANMVETLTRNYCERKDISISELDDPLVNEEIDKVRV